VRQPSLNNPDVHSAQQLFWINTWGLLKKPKTLSSKDFGSRSVLAMCKTMS
jgi:hypothetical protein